MKIYEWQHDGMVVASAELEYAPLGTQHFVTYEEAHQIEVDRYIKAANLQLLVEKVLAYDSLPKNADADELVIAVDEFIALARSLKQ